MSAPQRAPATRSSPGGSHDEAPFIDPRSYRMMQSVKRLLPTARTSVDEHYDTRTLMCVVCQRTPPKNHKDPFGPLGLDPETMTCRRAKTCERYAKGGY